MTTSATAALSGAPGAAPAAAPAPAAPAAPAPTNPISQAADQATRTTPTNPQWYDTIEDPTVKTWAAAKGFKDPLAATESAYHLEKLLGFDRAGRTLVIPDEKSTPEEIKAYNAKVGIPESPDGYNIRGSDGQPTEFGKWASELFHKAGVPAKSAESIVKAFTEYTSAETAKQDQVFAAQADLDMKTINAEWGAASAQNMELAKRAAAQFIPGTPEERQESLSAIERAMGTAAMLRLFARIGGGLGEHKMHGDTGSGSGLMTPAQAQQRINELKADKTWASRYTTGGTASKEFKEMQDLISMAYPGEGA